MEAAEPGATQPRPALLVLALGLAFVVAAAMLFGWLAGEVWEGDADAIDEAVLGWMVDHRTPALTDFFVSATSLGSWTVLGALGVGLFVALLLARRRGTAAALATSVFGAVALSRTLKLILRRPRPPETLRLTENVSYAFPSGHAIAGFAFFVTLALLAAGHVRGHVLRVFLVGYALGLGALVAVSRLYVGAHYLSDVIGGALVGTAWSVTVVIAERVWRHRRRHAG